MNPFPAFGVAVMVTGVLTANQAVPDGETEPPTPAVTVPLTELTAHCHTRRRYSAGDGCV